MHGLRRAGARPVLGSVVTGLAGLVGGVLVGWLGALAAWGIVGPFEFENPWNLFGNAIGVLGLMMVVAAGMIAGFVAGTVILPSLLMFALSWEKAGKTVLLLLLLLVPVVPLTIWLMVEVSSSSSGSVGVLTGMGAVVVGGLTPAAARMLATRRQLLPATRR